MKLFIEQYHRSTDESAEPGLFLMAWGFVILAIRFQWSRCGGDAGVVLLHIHMGVAWGK